MLKTFSRFHILSRTECRQRPIIFSLDLGVHLDKLFGFVIFLFTFFIFPKTLFRFWLRIHGSLWAQERFEEKYIHKWRYNSQTCIFQYQIKLIENVLTQSWFYYANWSRVQGHIQNCQRIHFINWTSNLDRHCTKKALQMPLREDAHYLSFH